MVSEVSSVMRVVGVEVTRWVMAVRVVVDGLDVVRVVMESAVGVLKIVP